MASKSSVATSANQTISEIDALLAAMSKIGDPKEEETASKSDRTLPFRVLDGGLGTWLFHKGLPYDDNLWSLSALIDEKYHYTVVAAHKDYLNAGADIITTNTYSCTPLYIDKCEESDKWPFEGKPDCAEMIRLAVDLANTARTEFMAETQSASRPLIAASIPLSACLTVNVADHDGK